MVTTTEGKESSYYCNSMIASDCAMTAWREPFTPLSLPNACNSYRSSVPPRCRVEGIAGGANRRDSCPPRRSPHGVKRCSKQGGTTRGGGRRRDNDAHSLLMTSSNPARRGVGRKGLLLMMMMIARMQGGFDGRISWQLCGVQDGVGQASHCSLLCCGIQTTDTTACDF